MRGAIVTVRKIKVRGLTGVSAVSPQETTVRVQYWSQVPEVGFYMPIFVGF